MPKSNLFAWFAVVALALTAPLTVAVTLISSTLDQSAFDLVKGHLFPEVGIFYGMLFLSVGVAWRTIEQQRRALARADETRQHLAAIVESSEDAIYTTDTELRITSWNQGAQQTFGYTPKEIIGSSVRVMVPPERVQEVAYIVGHVDADGFVAPVETQRLAKDGRRVDVSLAVFAMKGHNGRTLGLSAIARDITERKKAEEAMRHLAAIVESSDDAIISQAMHGKIASWNAAAERMFGYTSQEAVGLDIAILVPEGLEDELPVSSPASAVGNGWNTSRRRGFGRMAVSSKCP